MRSPLETAQLVGAVSACDRYAVGRDKLAFLSKVRPAAQGVLNAARSAGTRAARALSPSPAPAAAALGENVFKNLGHEARSQAATGALMGGVLGGGLEAALAPEGERGQAFLRGAGTGAMSGVVGGLAAAPVATAARNLRSQGIQKAVQAANPNVSPQLAHAAAQKRLQQGWGSGVKDLVTGKGHGGRRAAAIETLGAPAALIAENIADLGVTTPVLEAMSPAPGAAPDPGMTRLAFAQQEQEPPPAPLAPAAQNNLPPPIVGSVGGSFVGSSLGEYGLDRALAKGAPARLAPGTFLRKKLPVAAGALSAIGGYEALHSLQPPAPEEQLLQKLDINRLLRRYGKTDAELEPQT